MTDVPDGSYQPSMATDEVERIRRWHEGAYAAGKAEGAVDQTFEYLGATLVVPPGVQPITGASHLLGNAVVAEVRAEDRVLDMGTGSGVNAILAAATARQVVAVDINPLAVAAARANAERNGVGDRVEVRHSDVFDAVDGRFDLIVFDPPFRWFAPRDLYEMAITDENYAAMTAFFRGARAHLTEAGRMLIFFGTSGDLTYLKGLFTEEGFEAEVVATDGMTREGHQVDYFTFRLTLPT